MKQPPAWNGNATPSQLRGRVPTKESPVVKAVLVYLYHRPDVIAWRNNTGAYKTEEGQYIRYGYKGSADILGVIAPHGRFLAVECKGVDEKGRLQKQTDDQKHFQQEVEAKGGLYILAGCIEDVEDMLP